MEINFEASEKKALKSKAKLGRKQKSIKVESEIGQETKKHNCRKKYCPIKSNKIKNYNTTRLKCSFTIR